MALSCCLQKEGLNYSTKQPGQKQVAAGKEPPVI
jgi:hypothetical protein